MENLINNLDDATAIRVLGTIARAYQHRGGFATEWTPEVRDALRDEFGPPEAGERPSEGDLARQALLVLAADPEQREPMRTLIENPPAQRFIDPTTIGVAVAALIVLQTHVRFERDKDGRFSILIEKKPTKESLLKPLVDKILRWSFGG